MNNSDNADGLSGVAAGVVVLPGAGTAGQDASGQPWGLDERLFRRIDLNLLVVFAALYQTRHVTRASQRLYIGQSAVSAALARLRDVLDDPLFVRTARGMEPTARARQLAEQLQPTLVDLQNTLFRGVDFEPATSTRSFRLGLSDAMEAALVPELLQRIQRTAPGIRLNVRASDRLSAPRMLDQDEIDLTVSLFPDIATWQHKEDLYTEGESCLFDARRVAAPGATTGSAIGEEDRPFSLDEYLSSPHVLVSFQGDFEDVIDTRLAALGRARRVIASTGRFTTLPYLLLHTAALATVPSSTARRCAAAFGLAVRPVPEALALDQFTISMLWHARTARDAGQQWLRDQVRAVLAHTQPPQTALP